MAIMTSSTSTTGRPPGDDRGANAGVAARACIWIGLVAIGVCGRLWQPGWNVTPMAGVALAAGAVFPNPLVAATVPIAALALGNLVLPGYGSATMAAVVYAATAWPVLLGRWLTVPAAMGRLRWLAAAGGALASSLVFFLTTNLAHWWLSADYPHTAAGLAACFVAALPFYRWMPLGDLAWTAVILAGLSASISAARSSRAAAAA
ncbi:MAG: hypothetical protein EBZ74_11115 [Planctomycetia bacterium]|nr:hypothetical protein [Planctomycetia bacterium]